MQSAPRHSFSVVDLGSVITIGVALVALYFAAVAAVAAAHTVTLTIRQQERAERSALVEAFAEMATAIKRLTMETAIAADSGNTGFAAPGARRQLGEALETLKRAAMMIPLPNEVLHQVFDAVAAVRSGDELPEEQALWQLVDVVRAVVDEKEAYSRQMPRLLRPFLHGWP